MRTFAYWTLNGPSAFSPMTQVVEMIGGPDRDRTDDLFHAMEARSQLRHRPTSFYSEAGCGWRQCLAKFRAGFGNKDGPTGV
jgi:hypothetical protein